MFPSHDRYGAKIYFVGNSTPLELELSKHTIIDKTFAYQGGELRIIGPSSAPYLEYETKEDITGMIPLSSVSRIEFDKRFSKMKSIREKLNEKEENDGSN